MREWTERQTACLMHALRLLQRHLTSLSALTCHFVCVVTWEFTGEWTVLLLLCH